MYSYQRQMYLNRIAPYMWKQLIKVLIGARRVGKSVLLSQIVDTLISQGISPQDIISINKEHLEWEHIVSYKDLYHVVKNYKVICIDEIQEIAEREYALRDLQSKGWYDIYITWSNAHLLSGELATYLGGRYISFEVYPFTFPEFCEAHALPLEKSSFDTYMRIGGMPYLMHLWYEESLVKPYLKDIWDTITLRDIIQRFKVKDIALFQMLMRYLAYNIGTIFSAKNIADYHIRQWKPVSTSTVLKYLEYAKTSMVLYDAPRMHIKSKKLFEYKNKYYLVDTGLRNAIVGWLWEFLWWLLEQIVYMHLRVAWREVKVGEIGSHEVDFVCERDGKMMYIQVAYLLANEKTKNREFRSLLAIKDARPKYVLSLDEHLLQHGKGVMHRNIVDWLIEIVR